MNAWIGAIALAGMLASGGAMADGNDLLRRCQIAVQSVDSPNTNLHLTPKDGVEAGRCLGMVEGVWSTLKIYEDVTPKNHKVCLPNEGLKSMQAIRIVDKFLRDNPAKLNETETFLTILAFKQAYPCK